MNLIAFTKASHMPGMGGWGNGYVAVPKEHPCFGEDYHQIHTDYDIDVHGGLTYSRPSNDHVGTPETTGMWVVGFDTLHFGDTPERWPNEASVLAEAERLRDQLLNIVVNA